MGTPAIVGILNELLALEQRNLAMRLLESTVFISHLSVDILNNVRNMARASEQHGSWLADAILRLGGVPGPHVADAQSGDLHYQELRHLLPRLVADRDALVNKYTLASKRIGADAATAELVARIHERHREELTLLQHLTTHKVGATA